MHATRARVVAQKSKTTRHETYMCRHNLHNTASHLPPSQAIAPSLMPKPKSKSNPVPKSPSLRNPSLVPETLQPNQKPHHKPASLFICRKERGCEERRHRPVTPSINFLQST
ncbi:hypothetical protein P154DRAFT_337266 [Amniculicola lignicola CBS 123094]|uniref:Uncharacterized protein n=1 Tax=Amniculicola lignicola CBS 123094 TaxID=1392246 RepID=A0A6A5WXB4_9PLEO|nr:hypothetical protein P154DRAFT_337266 [Amniculicola lignicola CBS 123094]